MPCICIVRYRVELAKHTRLQLVYQYNQFFFHIYEVLLQIRRSERKIMLKLLIQFMVL